MTRSTRFLLSVLALLTLLGLVVGLPAALVVAVGLPFPDPWPTLSGLGDMVAGRAPVPADLVISILALVMWLLWFQVAWAVAVEVLATIRGRLAGRAPVLPGLQLTVGKLVTTATLLTSTFSVRPVAAGPLPVVASVSQIDEEAMTQTANEESNGTASSRSSGPSVRAYETEPGDTWWGIAEDVYGSGPRWKEIRNLNLGRTMDDGSVISVATDLLRPQWRLLLPAGAGSAAPTPQAAMAGAGAGAMERPEVVVEAGDTVWGLAEDDLEELGRDTSNVAVAERVDEIAEINRDELDGDPDLIFPGQRLELPARPALAQRAPAVTAEPEDRVDGTETEPTIDDETVSEPVELEMPDEGEGAPDPASEGATGPPEEADRAPDDEPPSTTEAAPPEGADRAAPTAEAAVQDEAAPPGGADEASPTGDVADVEDGAGPTGDVADVEDGAAPTGDVADVEDGAAPTGEATPATTSSATVEPVAPEVGAGDEQAVDTPTEDDGAVSPLSPVGELTVDADVDTDADAPTLAGARASSPDWIPASTPDVADNGVETSARVERTIPASAARTLVDRTTSEPTSTEEPTADLPAVGSGEGIDVVVSGSPGADEGLDTTESRAPIYVGLAALTLLGGYLFRAKGRRRKTVLQNRHPGRRPEPTKRRSRKLTRRLAAAAEPGHPEFVNLGLRALGRLLNDLPPEELPRISGVWVSQNRLVLALAEDTPNRPPPAPFTPFADGSGWSLSRSHFDEIRAIARGANGPLPLLTTVGTTTALDLALTTNSRAPAEAYGLASSLLFAVDLEAGRVISVDGRRRADVIETLTMMALELATSETADQAEIICVGFGHRLATFDRVIVVDELSSIMSDLEDVTSRAVYAAADASPFATRVRDGAADTWNPVIVFHADAHDPEAADLVDLAERTEGGVTLVCGYPADSGWRFLVDGDDVHCPDLPGSLAGHRFTRPRLGDADDIIDLFDDDLAELDLDDEFWTPLDDDEFAIDPGPSRPGRGFSSDAVGEPGGPVPIDDDLDPSRQAVPAVTGPGRPGGPAGPSPEPDLPPLALRHSIEHRADVPSPPGQPPAPTPPGTEAPEQQDQERPEAPPPVPAADDTPAPGPSGRHLYVVGESERRPDQEIDDETTARAEAGQTGTGADRGDTGRPLDVDRRPGAGPDDAAVDGPSEGEDRGDRAGSMEQGRVESSVGLRVNVLGNFTIAGHHVGDRAKPWKYTKTPELILYLLLHPGGASQDLLMEQLFPEQPMNRPRLNQLVSDARTKALGVDEHGEYHLPHASPSDPFYKLTTSVSFDLRDFAHHCARARKAESPQVQAREWQSALELVTGRPFSVPHDGFGWAMPEIEATIVKVEEAAVALADLAMELGDHRLAVWATKKGLLTGTGYYELLVKRGRAALLLEDPEEIVRAFADLQLSLDHTGAPEEGMPDLDGHPDLADVYNDLSDGGRGRDRTT